MSEFDKKQEIDNGNNLEELLSLKSQLLENGHVAKTCRFFRWLSGKSASSYSKDVEVSHTYWKELESGVKANPSYKVRRRIAEVSGLSYETVDYIFNDESIDFENIHLFIIRELNKYLEGMADSMREETGKRI